MYWLIGAVVIIVLAVVVWFKYAQGYDNDYLPAIGTSSLNPANPTPAQFMPKPGEPGYNG